jgi:hypothetical protein
MSLSWFISVDDHLIEPARLWQERLPQRWQETGPRIVRDGGSEFWLYEDRQIVTTGLNAVAGKKREEFSPEPITYADMRPGCYDPAARVADMNQGFVLASMLFPSFPRYCGQVFHEAKDRELALLCVRAWNDFILDELAGAYPGRFIPMMIIPLWDPAAAAAEIERTATRGAKSIAFSENPTKLGLPSIHTDYWHPVFRACEEAGLVISMHQPVGDREELDDIDRRRAARFPGRPRLRRHLHHGLATAEYPGTPDGPGPEAPEDGAHRGHALMTAVPAAVRQRRRLLNANVGMK